MASQIDTQHFKVSDSTGKFYIIIAEREVIFDVNSNVQFIISLT